jgi:NTE family protein
LAEIEKSDIPLFIIATNIESGEKIVIKEGNAVKAVLASSCLPGLFSPVEINGHLMADGGILESVPTSALKNCGAEIIIGVDLFTHRKYKRPKNIVDVLVNSFDMINHKTSVGFIKESNQILIKPDLSDFSMGDFKKWKEIAEIGYRETLKAIPEIKKLYSQPRAPRHIVLRKISKIIKKIL